MSLRNQERSIIRFGLLLAGLASASPAFAHAHLASASPAAGSSIQTPPQQLRLKFTEALELKFSSATLTGPDGGAVPVGSLSLEPADATVLLVPLGGALAPGRYKVEWHATATDTHKTQGTYTFTIKP